MSKFGKKQEIDLFLSLAACLNLDFLFTFCMGGGLRVCSARIKDEVKLIKSNKSCGMWDVGCGNVEYVQTDKT